MGLCFVFTFVFIFCYFFIPVFTFLNPTFNFLGKNNLKNALGFQIVGNVSEYKVLY